jgi:hypothetical protein
MKFPRIAILAAIMAISALAQQPSLSQDQIRALIRQSAEKDLGNDRAQRNYTYIQREEEHKLNGKGEVQSTETRTFEIMVLFEEPVRKLIARNDKPLPPKEAEKEEQKIQKTIDERRNESEGKRKKRLEKQARQLDEARQFVNEIADAYNFRLVEMGLVAGREAYVVDAEPRPGFEPKRKEANSSLSFVSAHGSIRQARNGSSSIFSA